MVTVSPFVLMVMRTPSKEGDLRLHLRRELTERAEAAGSVEQVAEIEVRR